jgi:hypothetical protein
MNTDAGRNRGCCKHVNTLVRYMMKLVKCKLFDLLPHDESQLYKKKPRSWALMFV